MTKKEWYKLKFQVIMGEFPDYDLVYNQTGWCHKCKYQEMIKPNKPDRLMYKLCHRECRKKTITTIMIGRTAIPGYRTKGWTVKISRPTVWKTGFFPKKFDKKA